MRPDIEAAIRVDQAETDKQMARYGRGKGNCAIMGDAYDAIFDPHRKPARGRYVMHGGHLVPIEEAPRVRISIPDNVNIVSRTLGCGRTQVDEFNRKCRALGIAATFRPDGAAVCANTAAQRALARARHCFLKNDTRSPRNV